MNKVVVFAVLLLGSVYTEQVPDAEYVRMPDLFGLDDYDSCLQETNSVYCVGTFELFADESNDLMNRIRVHSEDTIKRYNYSRVERGICATKTCKQYTEKNESLNITELFEKCVNDMMWDEYNINATLGSAYCDRHGDHATIDAVDWTVAGMLAVLVGLTLTGTYYDVKIHKRMENNDKLKGNKYLLCFSIFRNLQTLTWNQKNLQWESLKAMHFLRTLAVVLVVFLHQSIPMFAFRKDPSSIEKMYDNIAYWLIFDGLMVVQIFFFLSGFLLAYLLQGKAERSTGWAMIPKFFVMRWFRLTPVCAVMIAVMASWARHLGSGPLWKMAMTLGHSAQCRSYWWSHVLYVNNMVPDNNMCLIQTWHIAADMQMYILGLIVHVATRSRGRVLALTLLLVLGMLAAAVPVWLYGYHALHVATPEFLRTLRSDTFQYVHVRGYMNLPCFLLGMAAGYLGHHLQTRGTNLSRNTALRFLSWWFVPLFVGVIYSGSLFSVTDLRRSTLACIGYAVTHRAALGLLCAAWVLGLICRCNDAYRAPFTWRGWVLTSKLSYCVYIVHGIFLYLEIGLRRELTDDSFLDAVPKTIGVLLVSYLIAVPAYLMVESPFYNLIKATWDRGLEEKKNI